MFAPVLGLTLKKLASGHPQEAELVFAKVIDILKVDPYNRRRVHNIKKLQAVSAGDGHFRLKLGRWRFRYDITDQVVLLSYCGLRREETYR